MNRKVPLARDFYPAAGTNFAEFVEDEPMNRWYPPMYHNRFPGNSPQFRPRFFQRHAPYPQQDYYPQNCYPTDGLSAYPMYFPVDAGNDTAVYTELKF